MKRSPWYEWKLRSLHIDCHMPEWNSETMTRVDPKKVIAIAKKAGIQVFYVYGKCLWGNMYSNTKVGHKHVGIGEKDLVAEYIEEGHKAEMTVIVDVIAGWDVRASMANPDWRAKTSDGEYAYGELWPLLCMNTPARQYTLDHIAELATNYDLDGIFVDIPGWYDFSGKPTCYCDYCKRLFRSKFGAEIPTQPDWSSPLWRKFIHWRYDVVTNFLKEAKNLLKSIKPNASFTHNFAAATSSWYIGQDIEKTSEIDDYMVADIYWQSGGTITYSVEPNQFLTLSRGKPHTFFVRFLWPWDFMTSPKDLLMAEAMSAIANGNSVIIIDHYNNDGTIEESVYDLIGKVFAEVEKREEWLHGIKPIHYAALHFSQNTRDFYWRDNPRGYHTGYLAAYKVLLESHVPSSCIFDKNLNLQQLSMFKVLVLPNTACLTEEQADLIRNYVKQGGGLVATYKTSLCDEFSDERGNFALNDVFGADYFEPLGYTNSYIKLTAQHEVTEGVDGDIPLLITEPQLKVYPREDKTVLGRIVLPITEVVPKQRWFTHGNPPPSKETTYPAILAGKYGKGRVVYFASLLEQVIHSKAYPYAEKLLANAIRWAGGEPPVTANAPASVELTAFEQTGKNRIIVHLVNFQSQMARSLPGAPVGVFSEVIPVHNLEVTIRVPDSKKVRDVYLAPEKKKATFRRINGRITVTIPEVKIHRMVVLETE